MTFRRRPPSTTTTTTKIGADFPYPFFRLILLLLFSLLLLGSSGAKAAANDNNADATEPQQQSDWEDWDYYRILGFHNATTPKARSQLEGRDIRQAYRRQARRWHPDKHMQQKQKQQLENNNRNSSTTTNAKSNKKRKHNKKKISNKSNTDNDWDQVNRRFAKIAEAYQVLMDPEQRKQYDQQLQLYEQQQQQQQSFFHQYDNQDYYPTTADDNNDDNGSWSDWAAALQFMDPRQLFQDLFAEDDNDDDDAAREPNYASGFGTHSSNNGAAHQQQPLRVSQEEQILTDSWGNAIIRIVQRSEYQHRNKNNKNNRKNRNAINIIRVQVVAQDFVEEWDSWQHSWVQQPIGDPFVVEEYLKELPREILPGTQSLGMDETLSVGRYSAHLVAGCHLVVTTTMTTANEKGGDENGILWASPTGSLPPGYPCYWGLRQGHFVLSTVVDDGYGYYSEQEQIVWHSPMLNPPVEQEESYYSNPDSMFVGRLDADGVLATYQMVPWNWDETAEPLWPGFPSWWQVLYGEGTTHAARWWQAGVRQMIGMELHDTYGKTRRHCLWSSSRWGCWRLGRLVDRVIRDGLHWGGRIKDAIVRI